ncbi:MAG: 3'(2'),5'-bisphosphate nucleotidase CysQ [Hyphomonadaceae bacterium]|nr:3'(2'),5'-bisphosphate nucleotidase CysQ [Hyphomonadaceae bacterium]
MTLQSAASELELLEASVREAGAMARELSLKPLDIQSKGEAGPVTNVDKAVDAMLEIKFLSKRPDYGWLSEETPDNPDYRIGKERTFVLDPIDGTASLIGKTPQWTISAGLLDGTRAYAGVIYNPMTDEMFTGIVGHGAWFNGRPMKVADIANLDGARMIGQKSRYADKRWATPWPKMDIIERHSIAYRLALVAAGMGDATLLFGWKHEWDIAAGVAIVEAAGGVVTDLWGEKLQFNNEDPRVPGVAAAGASLHALLIERTNSLPHPREQATG